MIDLDTRLPIYAEFGKQKRNYQYGTPLTAPIVLPTQVADPAKDYEQRAPETFSTRFPTLLVKCV